MRIELPEVTAAERLELRPGDRLLVSIDRKVSDQDADILIRRIRAALRAGDDFPVLLLTPGMTVQVAGPGEAVPGDA